VKIALSTEQMSALKVFLNSFEDSEQLSEKEYVVDLYEREQPMSLDLTVGKDCLFVEGAAWLCYDEEMDGWYVGERIEEPEMVRQALSEAGAFGK